MLRAPFDSVVQRMFVRRGYGASRRIGGGARAAFELQVDVVVAGDGGKKIAIGDAVGIYGRKGKAAAAWRNSGR